MEEFSSSIPDKEPQKCFIAPETPSWKEIASDPAAIVILYTLTLRDEFTISEIEKLIPESLNDLFDKILALLHTEGLVEITETKIRLTRPKDLLCIFDTQALSKSTPVINHFVSTKALEGAEKNLYGNICRSFYYPIEQQEEAMNILRETRVKFQKLLAKSTSSRSTKLGYATFACTDITPEDFT